MNAVRRLFLAAASSSPGQGIDALSGRPLGAAQCDPPVAKLAKGERARRAQGGRAPTRPAPSRPAGAPAHVALWGARI